MTTPTHVAANLGVFLILQHIGTLNPTYTDLALIIGSNLIDLDHLFSNPIYQPRRNSFQTHFLHKNWIAISLISLSMFFFRPLLFLGIGLLMHFLLDYFDTRRSDGNIVKKR